MALLYNFDKIKDNHVLSVSQNSSFELYYISDKSNSLVITDTILNGASTTMPTTKDGEYKLIVKATAETDVIILFQVVKYLQNSIIREARLLLCGDTANGCTPNTANCLTKAGKQALTHKSIFVKLLTFQNLSIPAYSPMYSVRFLNLLEEGIKTFTCKIQTSINRIMQEECITGTVKDVETLFKVYVALYWAGMYFIERAIAIGDAEELEFIKTKFDYDAIVACLCSTCIDIEMLEILYNEATMPPELYSFQFDNIVDNISNANKITESFLTTYATVHTEESMITGKQITYVNTGRIGFAVRNNQNGYRFLDNFSNDITDLVFDKAFDSLRNLDIYISKEYYTPSTIYYRFITS